LMNAGGMASVLARLVRRSKVGIDTAAASML
jgi:hypothetical protein